MGDPGGTSRKSADYRPLRRLAEGGMAEVQLVLRQDGNFERLFAMKRIKRALRDEPHVAAMFLDEARLAALIRHPNVVSVIDVGSDADGPYLVMSYVEGISASELIRATKERGALLPVQLCARIAMQAALGLHAAHELRDHEGTLLGVVHRDVSPQNLLLGFDGAVRVTDFGIARAYGQSTRTSTGVLKGKVGYMAPEQLRFEPIDARADLFSLGVVLYELLAADRLYRGGLDVVAGRILRAPPPDIDEVRSDTPPELVQLLFELLAKVPDDRPANAAEVAERLEELVSELALTEGPVRLDAYLDEHFGDQRVRVGGEVASAIAELATEVAFSLEGQERDLPMVEREGTFSTGRAVLWAAAFVVVVAGLGGWLLGRRTHEASAGSNAAHGAAALDARLAPPKRSKERDRTAEAREEPKVGLEPDLGHENQVPPSAETGGLAPAKDRARRATRRAREGGRPRAPAPRPKSQASGKGDVDRLWGWE